MVVSLNEAKENLIKAQKAAEIAYKNVEKAREVYHKLIVGGTKVQKKKRSTKKSSTKKSSTKKSSTKKISTKKSSTKKKSTKSKVTKGKSVKSKGVKKMRGGGGSDWLSTVNSRGNVAGPNDHWGVSGAKWFDQFEKSGDYNSMSDLRRGSYELQKAASQAPKVPSGFDSNAQTHLLFNPKGDLGTQRI
ncbi:MAG: hypothetical protein ACOVNP_00880 [Flavobacterium sp.]|jgi:hypothetical protein